MRYGMYDVNNPRFLRSEKVSMVIGLIAVALVIYGAFQLYGKIVHPAPVQIISPIPEAGQSGQLQTPTATPTATPTTTPTPAPRKHVGLASYYSRSGCVGCSKTLTMANGEPLDDTKVTAAYNRAPLNSYVLVTHKTTTIRVKVTDRGGFERLGRVIDLSVAAKAALACNDLCNVTVEKLDN